MNIDKGVRNLFLGETAAVVSAAAIALTTNRTDVRAVFSCIIGLLIGLTAGVVIGWCWGYVWKDRPKED